MNCVELQESLADVEDGGAPEQSKHLETCPACAELLRELNLIIAGAAELQAADEPSPRVWNSIEIALRQEGLIRPQTHRGAVSSSHRAGWGGWLLPVAAMLLLVVGVYELRESRIQRQQEAMVVAPAPNLAGLNDDDLIQEVAANSPGMQGQYEENLRQVNDSIRDAQSTVDASPNDADARRSLMEAYEQKSMLFEMAMDRP
jgi:hypothetical protein